MPHALHALSQQIHTLSPAARLLLATSVAELSSGGEEGDGEDGDEELTVCLFWSADIGDEEGDEGKGKEKVDGEENNSKRVRVWTTTTSLSDLPVPAAEIREAIVGGMLHVDFKRRAAGVDFSSLESISLQVLTQPRNTVWELQAASIEGYVPILLGAQFKLLSEQAAPKNNSAEVKDLKAKLSQRDDEIRILKDKLSAADTTIARQAASASQHSAPANSPQKPPKVAPKNASKLQPNQKRRRVKGSDSDDSW
ncbi:hypothetical protein IAT38_005985 [Cryptococcus sp. DSM 104549]